MAAYLSRYRLRIAIILSAIVIIVYSSIKIWPFIVKSNVITIGYVGSYKLDQIPTEAVILATSSLITTDRSGKPKPALATNWTISENGKTYIVFLKDNLKWHDGTTVAAKDISIAIEDVKITAVNNKTIQFELPNPISSFPTGLDRPVFKTNSFYGTGDYRIVNIDKSGEIIQKISMVPKVKGLPSIEIKFYNREEQLINAIKIGEVKMAHISNVQAFNKWPNLEIIKNPQANEIVTIFYNTEDSLIADKNLRQALNFAINRNNFNGVVAHSPISPTSWAYTDEVKRYDYNQAKAKELLAKSSFTNPQITLSVYSDLKSVAEAIKKDWEELGVKVNLQEQKTISADFQVLLAIDEIPKDPDQYSLWHSSQKKTNLTRFKDVKIDKLLEDARSTSDEKTRKELYGDFQRFLTEESPAFFLYHPVKYKVTYKNSKDLINKLPY